MPVAYPTTPGVRFAEVSGFTGYCFGDDGTFYSRRNGGRNGGLTDAWHQLQGTEDKNGYRCVSPRKDDGTVRPVFLHRMILEAFVGPRPIGLEGCHGNGIKLDNRLSDLRWDTPASNTQDKFLHGAVARGRRLPQAKLKDADVVFILERLAAGDSQVGLARRFGVADSVITKIKKGDSWKHVPRTVPRKEQLCMQFLL